MADKLKDSYGPDVPARIGGMIASVHPAFPVDAFLERVLDGYEPLELTPRAGRIADELHRSLPQDYEQAIDILLASIGSPLDSTESNGMAPFLYLPHTMFVARYGLDHFETSMRAQYELTQRFTAEFSIRPFLEHEPDRTLARLRVWTGDSNVHVRRLVSEGTRPRLPWASRLRAFQRDPLPVLDLLELLKDDPEEYVRRSVANNLNDIGKDHPELLVERCAAWWADAPPARQRLIRHALRSLVKAGDSGALVVLGYAPTSDVDIHDVRIEPARVHIGERVEMSIGVTSAASTPLPLLIDLRVHFVKANGRTNAKVFKIGSVDLLPGEHVSFRKVISLAEMTTRRHYPGEHRIELLINGETHPIGAFDVLPVADSALR